MFLPISLTNASRIFIANISHDINDDIIRCIDSNAQQLIASISFTLPILVILLFILVVGEICFEKRNNKNY